MANFLIYGLPHLTSKGSIFHFQFNYEDSAQKTKCRYLKIKHEEVPKIAQKEGRQF